MQFAFETFRKASSKLHSIQLGKTRLTLRKKELILLKKLAKRLLRMNQSELALNVEPDVIQVNTPSSCGPLKDCRLQLVLNHDTRVSSFHFVARQASDDSLIYTSPAQVPVN